MRQMNSLFYFQNVTANISPVYCKFSPLCSTSFYSSALNIQLVNHPVPSFYCLTFGVFMPLSRSTALMLHGGGAVVGFPCFSQQPVSVSLSTLLCLHLLPSLFSLPPSFPLFISPTLLFLSLSPSLPTLHPTPSTWTLPSPRFLLRFCHYLRRNTQATISS